MQPHIARTVPVGVRRPRKIITRLPPVLHRLQSEEDEQRRGQRQQEFKHAHLQFPQGQGSHHLGNV